MGGICQAPPTTECLQKATGKGSDKTSHLAHGEKAALTSLYYRKLQTEYSLVGQCQVTAIMQKEHTNDTEIHVRIHMASRVQTTFA